MRRANFATAFALLFAIALPQTALAQRKSPLEGQPAVRHRLLLVNKRFEATAAFENSINTDFKQTSAFGLKLEFHLGDMLSIGAVGFYGLSYDTGLTGKIVDTLPGTATAGDPTPSRPQFEEHLNEMPLHGAAYASLTPWYGKLAAFGKFFVNFDFYFQGGLAVAKLKNECCSSAFGPTDDNPGEIVMENGMTIFPDDNPNNDPAINDGTKLGVYLGGGIHVFLSNFVALDLTIRDYMFSDNPSGLDFNADLAVTDNDNRFLNHLFLGAGLSFFLPPKVQRTN
jgi:outer membrane beta-barrel protein